MFLGNPEVYIDFRIHQKFTIMKTKSTLIFLALSFAYILSSKAQNVGITDDGNSFTPAASAVLELKSTSKGILIPRMTYAQRSAISSPAQGLMVYQTDSEDQGAGFYYNTSTTSTPNWVYVANTSTTNRSNHVLVKSLSDFPTPVSGVITLEDNISYEINGAVNIGTNRIVVGTSNIIYGIDKSDDRLIYTGNGSMITNTNEDLTIRTLLLYAPTSGSQVFDFTGSSNKIQITDNIFTSCNDLGTFNGGDILVIDRNLISDCSDGFEFKGTLEHLFVTDNVCERNNGNLIYLPSGTYSSIMIKGNYFKIPAAQKGLYIVSNSISVTDAKIVNNFFMDNGTYVSGVTNNYADWFFYGNTKLEDSKPIGFLSFDSNTVVTHVSSKNRYYKVSGNNFSSSLSQFDTNGVNNRLRYIGSKDIEADIRVNGSFIPTVANKYVYIAVVKNGSSVVSYKKIKPQSTTTETTFSFEGEEELEQNDYLEVWVRTQGRAFNITMYDLQFKIVK